MELKSLYEMLNEKRELKERRTQIPEIPEHILQTSYLVSEYALYSAMKTGNLDKFKLHFNNMLTILHSILVEGKKDYGVLAGSKKEHLEYLIRIMRGALELMEKNITASENQNEIGIPPVYKMLYGIENGQDIKIVNKDWRIPYGVARKKVRINEKDEDSLTIYLYKDDIKLLGFSESAPKTGDIVKGNFILKPIQTEKKSISDINVDQIVGQDVKNTLKAEK